MDVVVVGGGVIGSMAAHALAHRGYRVRVLARETGPETTSARAAASFKPSSVPRTPSYRRLLLASRRELDRWTHRGFAARSGISQVRHLEVSETPMAPRDYLDVMRDVRHLAAREGDDIPGGYPYGVAYTTYFFDVPVTLAALSEHLATDHGVVVERATVTHMDEVTAEGAQVVVNAAGLGAGELANDDGMVPVRGQTVRVPHLASDQVSISADGFYAYPRSDGIVLGGTAEHGRWDLEPDPATTARILEANARVVPGLADMTPIETAVGLRPYRRGGTRVELERRGPAVPIIHAYGHGGSGWTLGPGTGAWVAATLSMLVSGGVGR